MLASDTNHDDFTMVEYRSLLRLAKTSGYRFSVYTDLPLSERCILWRHDVDMSLNRAVRMAEVEAEEGIASTFFIYLHSEFYNILEAGQLQLAKRLVQLGGSIGLHFNPAFHGIAEEHSLDYWVKKEADVLSELLNVKISAFSFHNTDSFILTCEKNDYGGLVNCYSNYLKREVSYCSDSNGVWAHRRLRDVLTSATDSRLHVLTHPEWWQDFLMEPREKVFRCTDGRAKNVVAGYLQGVAGFGRPDNFSMGNHFDLLESLFVTRGKALEIQWLQNEHAAVFLEVWRLFERGIVDCCRRWFKNSLGASPADIEKLLSSVSFRLRSDVFFSLIYGQCWKTIAVDAEKFLHWRLQRDGIVHGLREDQTSKIDQGVVYMIECLSRLSKFVKTDLHMKIDAIALQDTNGIGLDADPLETWLEAHASTITSVGEIKVRHESGAL